MCCTERRAITVDDTTCGILGPSIRSPRRLRLPSDPMADQVCWMASLKGTSKSSGIDQHICDAVIVNSSYIMTPSECLLKLKKDLGKFKRVMALIGRPVDVFRQSLDFSQPRCGQEYTVNIEALSRDNVVRHGYGFLEVDGKILKDRCTCRVCLPSSNDLESLTTSSRCFASGFIPVDNAGKLLTI